MAGASEPQAPGAQGQPWLKFQHQAGPATDTGGKPWEKFQKPAGGPGMLTRMWRGLTGEDSSKAGRFATGAADPVVGAAQLAVHAKPYNILDPQGMAAAWQNPEAQTRSEVSIDRQVAGREARYEEGRRQAVPGINDPEVGMTPPKLATDWARLVGNVASPANLVGGAAGVARGVAGAALPLAARMGGAVIPGMVAGAAGGAMQPVTQPGGFGVQKAAQMATGGAMGAPLGAAGAAVGAGIGAAGGAARNALGMAPAASAADRAIKTGFSQAVSLPVKGNRTAPGIARTEDQRLSVVRDIVANKDNLRFDGPGGGEVVGQTPRTRNQLLEAFHQTKEQLYKKYDGMMRKAAGAALTGPSTINRFNAELQAATEKEAAAQEAVRAAQESVQTNAGRGGLGIKTAMQEHTRATDRLRAAQAEVKEAQSNVAHPWVDLKPAIAELEQVANDPAMLRDFPNIAKSAGARAERYKADEGISLSDAQRQIKNLNASLTGFYNTKAPSDAVQSAVDERVARTLRQSLDEMISGLEGPGYQELKLKHGAFQALEDSVATAARKEKNKGPVGVFFDQMSSAPSMLHILHGLATFNLKRVAVGAFAHAARLGKHVMDSPDRAIVNMFKAAEGKPVTGPGRLAPTMITGAGGAAADQQRSGMRYRWPDNPNTVTPPPGP